MKRPGSHITDTLITWGFALALALILAGAI